MGTLQLKREPQHKKIIFMGIVFFFVFITIGLLILLYPFASPKKEQFHYGDYPILMDGKIEENAVMDGKHLYIPINVIKNGVDPSVYLENNSLIITTKQQVIHIPFNKPEYFVNQKSFKFPYSIMIEKNNKLFLAMDLLKSIYQLDYHVTKSKRIVWIEQNKETYSKGEIIDNHAREAFLRLRTKPDLKAPYVTGVHNGESIRIEKQIKSYYFVRNEEGVGGYIKKTYVNKKQDVHVKIPSNFEKVTLPKISLPLHLSWEAVYTKTPDPDKLPSMPGVNVVSPTWFKLTSSNGEVSNLASKSYVNWAKKKDIQVWGVFSNGFDPELTKEAFSTFKTREKIINQLLQYMMAYQLDGLNIDIENVAPEDGPLVTQFVREVSAYLHKSGKIVSMDITFIAKGNWSEFYEREKLANVVDYLIVMAYDEHWANSPTAGSVASLPWVEENLQQILNEVPNEKLILGVPFYTRLWKEETKAGKTNVSSKALSMDQAKSWLKEKKLQVTVDPESGQNYVEYNDPKTNIVYKMWMEDEMSLKKRAGIADKYHLAGIASWSRYFADKSAWLALKTSLSAFNNDK